MEYLVINDLKTITTPDLHNLVRCVVQHSARVLPILVKWKANNTYLTVIVLSVRNAKRILTVWSILVAHVFVHYRRKLHQA